MKILHFLYDHVKNPWIGGGGAIRLRELYTRLAARGHHITVITGKYPGALDYSEGTLEFRFVGSDSNNYVLSTLAYANKAIGLIRAMRREVDVIIEDFAPWNPLFAHKINSPPVVMQIQNFLGTEILRKYNVLGLPFWLIERYYPKRLKHHVLMVDALARRFDLKGTQAVVSNGIDSRLLALAPEDGGYFLYMGRLDLHQKGLDVLARAIASTDARFIIAGDGKQAEKNRLAQMLGPHDNALLAGFASGPDKDDLLRRSLAMVLPSRYEGQGIVLLEGAACGKPAVVSDIPELRWAVDAGFALPFQRGNNEDLSAKLKTLKENPDLCAELGRRGKEFASGLTWDHQADAFEQYLEGVIEGAR